MGFFDKVKEKAAEAIEQGKDVAQTQQLKVQLKRLQGEEEEALSAFGNAAFSMWESGTLSMSSDLGAAASRIREVRAQIEAKKAEIAEAGARPDDDDKGTPAAEPVAAGTANTSQQAPPAMPEL